MKNPIALLGTGVALFLTLLLGLYGSFYQIDQGERGVVLRNGELVGIADPGLGFKVPIIDDVKQISIRDFVVNMPLEAYSYDQQPASMHVSVTYRVPADMVERLYNEYGTHEALQSRTIERRVPDAVKNILGKFTAARAIQEREKLGLDIRENVTRFMEDAPLRIVGVQVEEVSFSDAYERSIEDRMKAQVQIETTRQQKQTAEIQAEIKVVEAKAAADAQREAYQAEADGIRMRGEAEAGAILARGKALGSNPALIDLIAAERWNGTLPATQVPGSALPFIGIK